MAVARTIDVLYGPAGSSSSGREMVASDAAAKPGRERLSLIKEHDAAGNAVQLAAGGSLAGHQRLEELHGRREYDRRVPVFRSEAEPGNCGFVRLSSLFRSNRARNVNPARL